MTIATHCLVLNLRVGVWSGHQLDKSASQRLTSEASATDDAARVNKHLISKAALAEVTKAANALRTHFYTHTLPWKDNGDRVISRKPFLSFIEQHEKLMSDMHRAADNFAHVIYPAERERARFRMGALYNPSDYPSPDEVRRRFYASLDIDPVTEIGDFRVKLEAQAQQTLKTQVERAYQERVDRAMQSVWQRVADMVTTFAQRTAANQAIRVELVDNLREIVQILPDLNIVSDPQLESIRKLIESKLIDNDASVLRTDDAVRLQAAAEAAAIADQMRSFMAAFNQ